MHAFLRGLIILLFFIKPLCAISLGDVTEHVEKSYSVQQKKSFSNLDPFAHLANESESSYFLEGLYEPVSIDDELLRAQIDATFDEVAANNRFVKFLDSNALIELPVGIKTTIGPLEYIILIDSVVSTPEYSLLYASMSFETPKTGRIHFRGEGIKFSKKGGIEGGGTLFLVGDYPSQSEENKVKDKTQLIIRGKNNKTFVEFDCNGFKQFGLEGSLVFSNKTLLPEDNTGKIIPNQNVSIDFNIPNITNWNDILAEVSIDPFQVKGLDGVSFSITRAVIDMSDSRNLPGVAFPAEYVSRSPYHQSGNANLWRGVFIQNLTVKLPPQFATETEDGKDSEVINRVSFSGTNMLVDDTGFTGIITGENLIPIEKGKIGKWNFSLDKFEVELVTNSIISAEFNGHVDIPINSSSSSESAASEEKKSRLFRYEAMIKPGNEYVFNISNPDKINFNLWNAGEVSLKPASYVEIKLVDNKFRPKANLSGTMTINASLSSDDGKGEGDESKNVKLAAITFENLEIQSVKPYIKIGYFSLGTSSNNMGGFPLSINLIEGGQSGDELFLGVDVTIALTGNGEGGGGFGAGGAVRIISTVKDDGKKLSYKFKEVELRRFSIDIDQGSFKFKGNLNFYKEDLVYGNGISGTIEATFVETIELQASAIFGKVNGVRYWYVDALVDLGQGIPVFSGVFLNRFGGGAYYHMKIDTKGVGSPLGKTVSGIVYVPDKTVGLGLKAMVGIKGQDEKMFNADVTFEIAFRSSGGLKYINFRGNAYLLTTPVEVNLGQLSDQATKMAKVSGGGEINGNPSAANEILGSADAKGASIYAGIVINYDFENKTLHANMNMAINVAEGLITGGGTSVMHFAPGEWYIYIGRPEKENRIFLEVLGMARLDAYFVMGSVIPDSPPPPKEVSNILKGIDLDYMGDLNALADGAGVGFGASLTLDTGDKSFLIFYGRFTAGMGFDIMLKNYGNVSCVGRSGKIGIDGWYANGQSYAFFEGNIGIKVKLFGKSKKVDILEIGAAIVMQAKLPNPIWMRGVVGGYYSALGGMVKGQCSFELVLGEECEFQNNGSALEGVEVIAQLTPSSGSTDVDVFSSPQAVFNYEMERRYETTDFNEEKVIFKIALDHIKLTGPNGQIRTQIRWNDDKTIAILDTDEILPPEVELTLEVVTSFQEYKNGKWEISKSEGEELKEKKDVTFTTGVAPKYIPDHNVAFSYPTRNMFNLYKEEHGNGYVTLKDGQAYLFEVPDVTHIVRFSSSGNEIEVPLSYNVSNKEVNFSIPAALETDKVYQMNFVSVPTLKTNMEANVDTLSTKVDQSGVDASIRIRTATGTVKNYEEQEIYETIFRTSRYGTFREKIISIQPSRGWRYPVSQGVHTIGSNISGPEPFSYEEIWGGDDYRLIQMEADLAGNSWYNSKIYPLLYKTYPLPGNITIPETTRDVNILGLVPTKAIQLVQYPYDFSITESDINQGSMNFASSGGFIEYQLAYYMNKDYVALKGFSANYLNSHNSTNSVHSRLVSGQFPKIEMGDYYMNINYVLPGKNTVTSTYRHKIYNPIE